MKRARILLADDHELLLEAFKKLLEPEFEVVGTALDGRALLRMAAELKPDLIVLDISMPLLNGLDAGRQVKIILPAVKLIYLTMNQDLDLVTEALQIGANGYVLKNSGYSELRKAIRRGLLGRTYVTPLVTQEMDGYLLQDPMRRKQIIRLTARQREVLQLLAEGRSMKEAAHILNVTPRTVAFHKYRMMEDFNIHSNAELFKFAVRQHVA
jgi:DNA-binding NarL/FixJ family response regulator